MNVKVSIYIRLSLNFHVCGIEFAGYEFLSMASQKYNNNIMS